MRHAVWEPPFCHITIGGTPNLLRWSVRCICLLHFKGRLHFLGNADNSIDILPFSVHSVGCWIPYSFTSNFAYSVEVTGRHLCCCLTPGTHWRRMCRKAPFPVRAAASLSTPEAHFSAPVNKLLCSSAPFLSNIRLCVCARVCVCMSVSVNWRMHT